MISTTRTVCREYCQGTLSIGIAEGLSRYCCQGIAEGNDMGPEYCVRDANGTPEVLIKALPAQRRGIEKGIAEVMPREY